MTRFKSMSDQISGTIVAPSDPDVWDELDPREWLYFHGVKDFEMTGGGTINGMGQEWWARSCKRNASYVKFLIFFFK